MDCQTRLLNTVGYEHRHMPGVALLTVCCLATLVGCGGPRVIDPQASLLAKLRYPEAAERGDDRPILVVRESSDHIKLAHQGTADLHNVQLWLDRQWVMIVDHLPVGSGTRLDLNDAMNLHGETYPTGKFMSPDTRRVLSLAEVFDPATGKRHRMTVVPEEP